MRTKQSFFIECVGPPRFLGLRAKGWAKADGIFYSFDRARGATSPHGPPWAQREAFMRGKDGAGESDGARPGQSGPVVAQGRFAFEVAYRLQNAGTEQLSTSRRCTLQELSDTLQAEFPT